MILVQNKYIFENGINSIINNMFNGCIGLSKIIHKNSEYTNLSSFKSVFVDTEKNTISSSAFTGSNF